jgi:lipopolysaccharide export LptBFGC system permease protein LptF
MIFKNLWERHIFFSKIFKFFFFCLILIFLIYVIIDFSFHSTRLFTYSKVRISNIILYYLYHFILNINLFLPLALIFTTIKVLHQMNASNELTTLRVCGISKNRIFRPFFFLAFLICIFSYVNQEIFYTKAISYISSFKKKHLRKQKKGKEIDDKIKVVNLHSGKKLIYNKYNNLENLYLDVFYIISSNEIWHIKKLKILKDSTTGYFCDLFEKDISNKFYLKNYYKEFNFTNLDLTTQDSSSQNLLSQDALNLDPSFCSIKDLYIANKNTQNLPETDLRKISTLLNYKVAMPLISFIIVLGLFPICTKKDLLKKNRIFFVFLFSIISFIFFYILMESLIIIGENGVFNPKALIWTPPILLLLLFIKYFHKES